MGHPSPPPGKPRIPAPKVYGAKPRSPQGASGASSPVPTGLIVATLYAVLWTLLVYVVHNPVSLAGWGAGGLIGIALARAARAPSPSPGTFAVVLTVGTVVVAKALILAFALRPILVDEIVRHPEATRAVYVIDMTTHRTFSPDLQAALDTLPRRGGDTARADRSGSTCCWASLARSCRPRRSASAEAARSTSISALRLLFIHASATNRPNCAGRTKMKERGNSPLTVAESAMLARAHFHPVM